MLTHAGSKMAILPSQICLLPVSEHLWQHHSGRQTARRKQQQAVAGSSRGVRGVRRGLYMCVCCRVRAAAGVHTRTSWCPISCDKTWPLSARPPSMADLPPMSGSVFSYTYSQLALQQTAVAVQRQQYASAASAVGSG